MELHFAVIPFEKDNPTPSTRSAMTWKAWKVNARPLEFYAITGTESRGMLNPCQANGKTHNVTFDVANAITSLPYKIRK
uniref:Uncharacterized protein n=1 Tax=Steinernema glaseri TaxID=37863 RepID=A0A1I7Y4V4_9BILA